MFKNFISWFFCSIALAGKILNAKMNKWGFVCWMISNSYMTVHFWNIGEPAQSVLNGIYLICAFYGFNEWGKKQKQNNNDL